jgi:hypothetical protein
MVVICPKIVKVTVQGTVLAVDTAPEAMI